VKKAFTLVELLAVIVIMSLVFGLVAANVIRIMKSSANSEYESLSDVMEKAAKIYINSNAPTELDTVGGTYCVTLSKLATNGLISLPIVDPRDSSTFDTDTCVLVTALDLNKYSYEFNPDYNAVKLIVLGNNPDTVSCAVGGTYTDAGADVIDPANAGAANVYATKTLSIATGGTYYMKYKYSGGTKDVTTTRKVIVTDNNRPVITVENGTTSMSVPLNGTFTVPLATATDACDGDLDVTVTSNVVTTVGGTYYVTYTATNSGGTTSKWIIKVIVKTLDTSGASAPDLPSNMIPVYYDAANGCWRKADSTNSNATYQWYDYNAKKWANAITVTNATRATYKSAALGTAITSTDVLTYMVWIPRYSYYITTSGTTTPSSINISFESSSSPKSTGNAVSTYLTHPAFTFGTQELNGIWVGKYETTGSISSMTILPGTVSLKSQSVSTFFTAIRNMETSGNTYGYIASEVDTHMMLNSEWGAVAYLAYSVYGKNSEVWVNPNSNYLTGQAGTAASVAATTSTYGFNDTTYGVNASTTGNVTGVYDMSGGANEYVMGNYNNYSGSNLGNNSGFSGLNGDATTTVGLSFPSNKYYNLYTTITVSTACGGGICYGQALSETSGWNSDVSSFLDTSNPWFVRGGFYTYTNTMTDSGLFYYLGLTGNINANNSTRIVVTKE